MNKRILVWDVPTRVFHWTMVLSFGVAYLTAESERTRDMHVAFGYILLGMLVFRLVWGFAGTHYARFGNFLFGPREVATYVTSLIRRKPVHYVGHNPAGSVAIWLLLLFGLASSVSGVLVYQELGGDILEVVHEITSNAMLAVVAIHLLGVLVSSLMHRENLVRSMITGYKTDGQRDGVQRAYGWLGAVMLTVVVAYWLFSPAGFIK
ncbi:MAG: cytochrome b/b6 domain-containing protein [Gallionella sp.]